MGSLVVPEFGADLVRATAFLDVAEVAFLDGGRRDVALWRGYAPRRRWQGLPYAWFIASC